MRALCVAVLCISLGACSVVDRVRVATPDLGAKWVLLPIANHTETAQAGLRSEAIIESVLRAKGVKDLERYPVELNSDALLDPAERKLAEQAIAWARSR